MYLFRGEFGCMLYTGDFRWESKSERAQIGRTMLLSALRNEEVRTLYLDNTYCNPSYCFPSREIAAQKIWVWPERLQTMHVLGFDDIFTTKTSLTRVRAVPRYSFSIETLEGLNATRPTIGIMPSGLPWLKTGGSNGKAFSSSSARHNKNKENTDASISPIKIKRNKGRMTVERYHPYIYNVLYSDHSSFPEIEEFVKLLQPINIMGIVSSSPSYVDPLYFLGHLCGANQLSPGLNRKLTSKEEKERKRNYVLSSDTLTEGKRKRRLSQVDFLGVSISRVSLLRRKTQGVKLVNFDCASD